MYWSLTSVDIMRHIKIEVKRFILRPSFLVSLTALSVLIILILFIQHPNNEIENFHLNYGLTIQLFILPLFVLLLGSMYISEDIETKWVHLLHIYSFTPVKYIIIKWLTIFIGFVIFLTVSIIIFLLTTGVISMLAVVLLLMMLLMYSSLSVAIGSFTRNRIQAVGISLLVWSISTLIAPLLIVYSSEFLNNINLKRFMIFEILANPTSHIRLYYYYLSESLDMLGPGFYDFSRFLESTLGTFLLVSVSLMIFFIPIFLSIFKIAKEVKKIS